MALLVVLVSPSMLAWAVSPPLAAQVGDALRPSGRIVAQLGKREVFLQPGQYGLTYFPDGCLALVRTSPDYRILIAAGVSTCLLEGRGMRLLRSLGKVLGPGEPGTFDNGYAGISGTARDPATGRLLAFYHAEDQEKMPRLPSGIPGFYCSVGLAVSEDDGVSFQKLGPVICGSLPKDFEGRGDQGCGEVSIAVDKDGLYVLAYYSDHSRVDGRGVQICLARCPIKDAARTDGWKKYYRGGFNEPGLGGKDTPVVSMAAARADAIFPHVAFAAKLQCYLMVFNVIAYEELNLGTNVSRSGIYAAYSRDGIHWSAPAQLLSIRSIATIDEEVGWHPTLILDAVEGNSAKGWLFYSYSERWGHRPPAKPHYLVGQPISLSIHE